MRTFLIACIICAFTAGSTYAVGPSLYLGGALQVNAPTGAFAAKKIQNAEGGAKTGAGGEIDFGLTGKTGSAYVGYRIGQLKASTDSANALKAEKWMLNRFVVGLRWHILGETGLPIVPTLGGGITIGGTKADIKDYQHNETASKTAKSSLGWFLELGGILRPPGPLSVIADIQYHSFNSKFDGTDFNKTFAISFVTIQAGLRLELSAL